MRFFNLIFLALCLFAASSYSQECRSYSYASFASSLLNTTYDISNSVLSTSDQVQKSVLSLYQALQTADRGYNYRLTAGYSNGDCVSVINCRISEMKANVACIQSKTEYIAEVRALFLGDQLAHYYSVDAAGYMASTQVSQSTSTMDVTTSTWWTEAVASQSNSDYQNNNQSYWFKSMNPSNIIFNGDISLSEPCADQCKANSYAPGVIDGLAKLKDRLLAFKGITQLKDIYSLAALMLQYATYHDQGSHFMFVGLGFSNDDMYSVRKCQLASSNPIQDSCVAAPGAKYVFQARNYAIYGDYIRHAYVFQDPVAGTLSDLNSKEKVFYNATTKPWYIRAMNSGLAGWTSPAVSSIGSWTQAYSSPLYDASNTLTAVLIADHVIADSCKPTSFNSYAYSAVHQATKDVSPFTVSVTSVNQINSIFSSMSKIWTSSDRDSNAMLSFTDKNGNFYAMMNCNQFALGNHPKCLSSRNNEQSRMAAFIRNPTVLGQTETRSFYLVNNTVDLSQPTGTYTFDPLNSLYYTQSVQSGFSWTAFSEFALPNGRVYSGPLYSLDSNNAANLVGVFSGYEVAVDLTTDATTPLGYRLLDSVLHDKCVTKSMAFDATISLATNDDIISATFAPVSLPNEVAVILTSLYSTVMSKSTGYLSVLQYGTPSNEYYGIFNCSSPDTQDVPACVALGTGVSTTPLIYQIVNNNIYQDYKLRAIKFDATSGSALVSMPTPFYTSSNDFLATQTVWYKNAITFKIVYPTSMYRPPFSSQTVTRAISMPIRLGNTLASSIFLGVASADKPTNEPCVNLYVRHSFVGSFMDCTLKSLKNNNLDINTQKLSEVESILSAMSKCIIANVFRTSRSFYIGAKDSKNAYIIRNCKVPINKNLPFCSAASGAHYIGFYVNPAIRGNMTRFGYAVTPTGDLTPLSITESSYDVTTRPWYVNSIALNNIKLHGWSTDAWGRPALQYYSSLFNSTKMANYIGLVGGDVEDVALPVTQKQISSMSPCNSKNGGCSSDATCDAYLDDALSFCTCKQGFFGNGFTCTAIPVTPTSLCLTNNPCSSDANCFTDNNDFSKAVCVCKSGFTGNGYNCTKTVTPTSLCLTNNPCSLNADCFTDNNDFSKAVCVCKSGYTGNGYTCVKQSPSVVTQNSPINDHLKLAVIILSCVMAGAVALIAFLIKRVFSANERANFVKDVAL